VNSVLGRIFKFILTTKLFWGLAVLYATGVIFSPVNNKGVNIFLSPGNQADVLRQVSNNGIIAVGMTLVILTGGIDLSVGSMMALGSVICAMLLTQQGWTNASLFSIPILAVVCVMLCLYLIPLVAKNVPRAAHRTAEKPATKIVAAAAFAGIIVAAVAVAWTIGQLDPKFGVPACLLPCRPSGLRWALNGVIIARAACNHLSSPWR
jgi:simple sugar transport system permease protein